MAGFEYQNYLANVVQALKDYNTTTSSVDLSANLSIRVNNDNIKGMFPKIEQIRADLMPSIFISIANKEEEYSGLGATGASGTKKMATVNYNIYGFAGKQEGWGSHSTTTQDLHNLARNIEAIYQTEYKLSNTAMFCNCVKTEFGDPLNINQNQTMVLYIQLQAKYLFR